MGGGQEELQQRASALEAERARLVDEHKAELEKLAKAKVARPPTPPPLFFAPALACIICTFISPPPHRH
jgi:hypothetical protein